MKHHMQYLRWVCPVIFLAFHVSAAQTVEVEARVTPEFSPGPFQLEFRVTSTSAETTFADIWVDLVKPGGDVRTKWLKTEIVLPPHESILRSREHSPRDGSPRGPYTFIVTVGTYPDVILASDSAICTIGVTKLGASDGAEFDYFGISVSISGDYAVIGALGDDYNNWNNAGSAYIYQSFSSTQPSQRAGPVIQSGTELSDENFTNETAETVGAFSLFQNHPNPFNPMTAISYSVPVLSRVTLEVFNTLGQRVTVLVDGIRERGYHSARWNGTTASGIYFYRLEAIALDNPANHFVDVKKMIYLR